MVPGNTPLELLDKKPPASYGPFKIGKVEPNRSFEMIKNEDFDIPGVPPANVDKIDVVVVKSLARQVQDVISGDLDYMTEPVPADQLAEVRGKYSDRFEEQTVSSTYYFYMDTQSKPFNNKRVREAVNLAVDSTAISRIYGGLMEPSCNFLPEGLVGYEKIDPCPWGDPEEDPDLEKAAQIIEEEGVAGTELKVWGNDEEPTRRTTEYYADTLNKIGFKAEPEIVEASVYFDTIGSEKTGVKTGFINWFPDYPHPYSYLFLLEGKTIQPTRNQNYSRVDDPVINRELPEAARGADRRGRRRGLGRARQADHRGGLRGRPFGQRQLATFVSERIDFENCTRYHPVYYDDYTSFCLD